MPAASTAALYGDGPPGSHPVTIAPAAWARSAAAEAPAPAIPTTWIRSPFRMARGVRTWSSPAPISVAVRVTERSRSGGQALEDELEGGPRAGELVGAPFTLPGEAAHLAASHVGDGHVGQSDRLL